jgi:hypothetical protein
MTPSDKCFSWHTQKKMEVQVFSELNIAISSTAVIYLEQVTTYMYCTERDFVGNIYSNSLPFGTLLVLS